MKRLVLCLLVLAACIRDLEPTQVMVRVYASQAVLEASRELRVRVVTLQGDVWRVASEQRAQLSRLELPLDVPVVPGRGRPTSGKFEVIVDTLDEHAHVVVESRVLTSFVPRAQKLLEIELARCPVLPLGETCSAEDCLGTECLTCSQSAAMCVPVPQRLGSELPDLEPGASTHENPEDPALPHLPGLDAGFDGSVPVSAHERDAGVALDAGEVFDAGPVRIPPSVDRGPCAASRDANMPFGAHRTSYVAGAILPSHLYRSERDAVVAAFYDRWKSAYLRKDECPGRGGLYALANDDPSIRTASDRHGYAMLITALMAGHDPEAKALFDDLYAYYLDHPSADDGALMARTQVACSDKYVGSASDGDLDIAYALLLADKQWGSDGLIDYRKRASEMIAAIWSHDVDAKGRYMLLGAGVQSDVQHLDGTRTSDFMPGHLVSFASAGEHGLWRELTEAEYAVIEALQRGYAESTGLVPDFAQGVSSDRPMPAEPGFFAGDHDGKYSEHACRVPLRIALHYLTSGNARAQQTVERINAWIDQATHGDPLKVKAGYALDGSPLRDDSSMAFVAPLGVAAMASKRQDWLNALWDALSDELLQDHLYLGDTLELLSLIAMSGNWWTPESVACAVKPPPPDAGMEEEDSGVKPPVMMCKNERLAPASEPPCQREPTQVPMWVSLGFTDTGDVEGLRWALEMAEARGLDLTFFVQCAGGVASAELRTLWQAASSRGHELASYAMSTPADGRTLDAAGWKKLVEDCSSYLVSQNISVTGFRAPGLRYDEATFAALEELGFRYDSSIRESFGELADGTNDMFPYTLGYDSPGHQALAAMDPTLGPLGSHPYLWELPVYDLLPPPALRRKLHERQQSYRTRLPPSDTRLWAKRSEGGFELSKAEMLATLRYTFDRRMQGNHAPLILDLSLTNYGELPATSAPGATLTERREAIEEFVDYVSSHGGFVTTHQKIAAWTSFPAGVLP